MATDLKVKLRLLLDGFEEAVGEFEQLSGSARGVGSAADTAAGPTARLGRGLGEAGEQARRAEQGVSGTTRALRALQGAAAAAFAALSVRELARLADAYADVEGRLGLVTDGTREYQTALAEVSAIARDTSADIVGVGELYAATERSLAQLGETGADAAQITRTIGQALALGGGNAEAADAALRQLVQGLQSGVLRGEEFNSVMEQAPRLALALADGLGVTVGELRALANTGALTADVVIDALQGQAAVIEAEFANLPDTVGRAMTRLRNTFIETVGELNRASGATETFGAAADALGAAVRALGAVLRGVLDVLALIPSPLLAAVAAAASLQAAWGLLTTATGALTAALTGALLGSLSHQGVARSPSRRRRRA